MSLTTNRDRDSLFKALASSGAYEGFLKVLQDLRSDELDSLNLVAVAALADPTLVTTAQMIRGRYAMIEDLIAYAEKFTK